MAQTLETTLRALDIDIENEVASQNPRLKAALYILTHCRNSSRTNVVAIQCMIFFQESSFKFSQQKFNSKIMSTEHFQLFDTIGTERVEQSNVYIKQVQTNLFHFNEKKKDPKNLYISHIIISISVIITIYSSIIYVCILISICTPRVTPLITASNIIPHRILWIYFRIHYFVSFRSFIWPIDLDDIWLF